MRIISKFDDYYDYLVKVYGVDNKTVYNRLLYNDPINLTKRIDLSRLALLNSYINYMEHEVYVLVVCDKRFLVSYKKIGKKPRNSYYDYRERGYEMFDEREFLKHVHLKYDGASFKWVDDAVVNQLKSLKYVINHNDNKFLEISRLIGQPIYFIRCRNFNNCEIVGNSPILKDIKGFSKFYEPTRLYQDISYYVGNILKENPDTKSIVEVSNKTKIIKAGFDVKTSFRGK